MCNSEITTDFCTRRSIVLKFLQRTTKTQALKYSWGFIKHSNTSVTPVRLGFMPSVLESPVHECTHISNQLGVNWTSSTPS
jgi:hypothetical protein